MRTIQGLGAIAALVAGVVYFNFGTLSPCGVLRETVRHRDALAAVLPDSIIDLAISAQYGALSPGRCVEILLKNEGIPIPKAAQATQQPVAIQQQQVPQAPRPPMTGEEALKVASKETETAINECRAKRLSGELKTFVASVKCSNPRIVQAYSFANYRYMDLIALFAAKRLQVAERLDRNELTEIQANFENTKLFTEIVEAERRRDGGVR